MIVTKILEWVLPLLIGPLVYAGARELLNLSATIDDAPAFAKRIFVVLFATLVSAGFAALGLTVPPECSLLLHGGTEVTQACAVALTQKVPVQGVTAGIVAMIIHAVKKQQPRS